MDLSYSAEYERFRAEVRTFVDEHWTEQDRNSSPAPDGQAALMGQAVRTDDRATQFRLQAIERGYLYRHVPKAYGGSEQPYDPLKSVIISEEFRRAKAPGEVVGQGPSMLAPIPIPMNAASEIGVSTTRLSPNFFHSPRVTL